VRERTLRLWLQAEPRPPIAQVVRQLRIHPEAMPTCHGRATGLQMTAAPESGCFDAHGNLRRWSGLSLKPWRRVQAATATSSLQHGGCRLPLGGLRPVSSAIRSCRTRRSACEGAGAFRASSAGSECSVSVRSAQSYFTEGDGPGCTNQELA
jgi:hypothetical protein